MKRFAVLLLTVCLLCAAASGCGNNGSSGSKSGGSGKAVESTVTDNVFVYSVTRSAEADEAVETAAKDLRTAMKNGFGCNVIILKDTLADYDGNYEILVGDTNREESKEALERIKNNRINNSEDFLVKAAGDKIVIAALNDRMLTAAVEWFAKTFCESPEAWSMLRTDYEFFYTPELADDAVVNKVNGENIGLMKVVEPLSYSYLCGREVDKYVSLMNENGYTVAKSVDGDNESDYEILVGDLSRPESQEVKVSGDNYVIAVKGKKLVIKGGSDLSLYRGIKEFSDMIRKAFAENKSLILDDGYVYNGKYDASEQGTYTYNWGDEFNGSALDLKKWGNYGAFAGFGASNLGGRVNVADVTDTDYVRVKNGNMEISARKVSDVDFCGVNVTSGYSMIYRYGLWEVCAKVLPAPATTSFWENAAYLSSFAPSIGSMTRNAFTEIDLVETFGRVDNFASNVHRWWSAMDAAGNGTGNGHTSLDGNAEYNKQGNSKRCYYKGENLWDGYHIYSFYSDDKCMEFAFDGKVYCKYNYADDPNGGASILCQQNFILLSACMGRSSYGAKWVKGTSEDVYTGYIDYTRIYQTNAVNSQMRLGSGNALSGVIGYVYPETPKNY